MKYGGSNWNDLSGTSFSVPTEADYTDKLKVKATLGNETRDVTGSIGYDKTPPEGSIGSRIPSQNDATYINFSDKLSGMQSVKFVSGSCSVQGSNSMCGKLNGTFVYPSNSGTLYNLRTNITNNANWYVGYSMSSKETKTIRLQLMDLAGNQSTYDYWFQWTTYNSGCTNVG